MGCRGARREERVGEERGPLCGGISGGPGCACTGGTRRERTGEGTSLRACVKRGYVQLGGRRRLDEESARSATRVMKNDNE